MSLPARARLLAAAVLAAAAIGGIASSGAAEVSAGSLSCVAPTDVAGIDAQLASVESPLAGHAAAFVSEGTANGVDPRALVAIAAHETLLMTYGPSQRIRNPFGLGPGWSFDTEDEAIATAAGTLRRLYLSQGLTTLPEIGAKWAPVGADNDPGDLNGYWPGGVGAYYTALGGDPSRPIAIASQDASPACGAPPAVAATSGPAVVTVWGGRLPQTAGPGMHQGGDPHTGLAATVAGFTFPVAPPRGTPVRYRDEFTDQGSPGCYGRPWACRVTLQTAPGVLAVAAAGGTLRAAGADEQAAGVAFWIEAAGGDRVGYSGLASYSDGIREGAAVRAGQALGQSTGTLEVSWTRDGLPVNPFPLLAATRAPDA